ncbi:hypothetical protein JH06_2261 [Blastocystis sp. subtype 4]|uniref:hypothetical protein n=1 Tax=Blastocystis sp. subtype 4 TaxID=944170 RepID=UPI00071193C2|nr:hypothetical protein JH06_2261 [Blastocystis sp. subtype 4]KNB43815.1 hypothetical protein JH06_2261 [Blastocystis sp. subtype 4]|eukprot:XP_014527258.1 hypothetical protein JH06_2261 [Blastocystis sp. subtype 4]
MSDTFQTNYKSASNIIKNINSIFAAIKENTNLSETQKQLGRVKQYYGQAQEALKIMRNTASTMTYNNKIQAMGFVRDIEQSLASIKKEISRLEAKLNKASLMGPNVEEKKKKMAEGINKLNEWVNNGVVTFRTNEVLKKVKASAIESENIGQEALGTLENQRESLSRSINKVDEVKTNANQAKQLLRDMNRRAIGNKLFVSVIIFLLVAANAVMLYLNMTKNKK